MHASGQLTTAAKPAWWSTLADASFLAMFLYGAFPETLIGKLYIGPAPLCFWIFYLGAAGLALEIAAGSQRLPGYVLLLMLVGVALTLHGFAQGATLKWVVIDGSNYAGLLAGLIWVQRRPIEWLIRGVRRLVLFIQPLLALALIGLVTGLVPSGLESSRLYTYSISRSATYLALLLPLCFISRRHVRSEFPEWLLTTALVTAYLLMLASTLMTGTRSILAAMILSSLLTLRLIAHQKQSGLLIALLTLALLGGGYFLVDLLAALSETPLVQRVGTMTTLRQETRYLEIEQLMSQLTGSSFWTGLGFGSRFHSPIIVDGSDLAISPHIGIFAFLQKGGLPFFLLFVLVPYLVLPYRILRGREESVRLSFYSGALLYLLLASMSAGWEFYSLFLYGSLLGGSQA